MEQYSFSDVIDGCIFSDKLKILLKKIEKNLIDIQDILIGHSASKSFDYISKIIIMFHIYGLDVFKEDKETISVLRGSFLYSLPIENKKIQCPRSFTNEQKAEFKKTVADLIKTWSYIGSHFSYEKVLKISITNEDYQNKLTTQFRNDIYFV